MELLPQKIEQYSEHYDDHSLWNKIKSAAAKAGRKVIYNALLLYYMLTDATIPLKHKRLIVGVLGYFILPIDLIPDFLHDSITPAIKAKAESKCNEYFKTDNKRGTLPPETNS